MKQKFDSLDSLRGIAALLVALYHVSWSSYFYDSGIVRNSYIMVDFFFVLSGFVIYHNYGDTIKKFTDVEKFIFLRFGRLYPLHLAFLIIFLLIELAKYIASTHLSIESAHNPPFSRNNLSTFVSNLFLIHSLGIHETTSYNGPSWSISVEFYTYLLFACVAILSKSNLTNRIFSALLVIASFAIILSSGHTSLNFDVKYGFMRCVYGFFIGRLSYDLYLLLQKSKSTPQTGFRANVMICLLVFGMVYFLNIKQENPSDFLFPIFAGITIITLATYSDCWLNKLLGLKPFLILGALSYSIYMSHNAIQWVMAQILRLIYNVPTILHPISDMPILSVPDNAGGSLAILYALLVVGTSWLTYTYIEVPFRRKSKELIKLKEINGIPIKENRV